MRTVLDTAVHPTKFVPKSKTNTLPLAAAAFGVISCMYTGLRSPVMRMGVNSCRLIFAEFGSKLLALCIAANVL
jgi:hypothetical protein